MLHIKGWSHALLEDGALVGVAQHVEQIEHFGPMGVVYFFGSLEPPAYARLNTMETIPLGQADSLTVKEIAYELARNSATV